ncbi:OadG family protein [Thermobrachium celere]|uniref:Sodium pump decarboxylase, gamma subunit n=1 Tax=Thermobrachium celere DSM 8682 TaxID=941824 RepID=R7RSE8_9CLOT|nr:OadG family protein [Thermobrachium celere]GFR35637.1 hypothetical protein TCEA9_14490 [Thermobrachium celere]CDF59102.1 sodium pump decarboxylase, gamma subunit [Thermobrachium celere DSM 8682]
MLSLGDKLLLGVNTTIISMTIVFIVLIFLGLIIKLISKVVEKMNYNHQKIESNMVDKNSKAVKMDKQELLQTTGSVSGQINLKGEVSDDEIAAVLAVVAHELKRPLEQVKINSIKLINE